MVTSFCLLHFTMRKDQCESQAGKLKLSAFMNYAGCYQSAVEILNHIAQKISVNFSLGWLWAKSKLAGGKPELPYDAGLWTMGENPPGTGKTCNFTHRPSTLEVWGYSANQYTAKPPIKEHIYKKLFGHWPQLPCVTVLTKYSNCWYWDIKTY